MAGDFDDLVRERLGAAALDVDDDIRSALCGYLALLARWNRRINLTAFDLEAPTPHAIDRLIVEPVVATRLIRPDDRVVMDVGSGGGSPALPLKIAAPWLRMTLIEARVRKSAFLREAVRELGLDHVEVETTRLEQDGLARLNGTADVVTLRAVRADAALWRGIGALLGPNGRVFWFSDGGDDGRLRAEPPEWAHERTPLDECRFLRVFSTD